MLSTLSRSFLGLFSQRAPWVMLPLLLVCGKSGATPPAATGSRHDSQTPQKLPLALRAAYIASVQNDAAHNPDYRIDAASRSAENPRQMLTTQLSAAGIRLDNTDGGEAFHAALALHSYGCAAQPVAARPTPPQVTQNRVEYVRDGLTEWYVNGPLGVEQGFTLATAPRCATAHDLVFNLAWDTDLVPTVVQTPDAAGERVELRDGAGKVRLAYSDLYAYDAAGQKLPAQLSLAGRQLSLHINDQGAQYPVTVDPLIWSQQAKLLASDGASGDLLGSSVAISGDTAIIGDPHHYYFYTGQGAAYVFVRSAGQWVQQQRLTASDAYYSDSFGTTVAISGDTAVIGAPNHTGVGTNSGEAYVFTRSGTSWSEQTRLTAPVSASGDLFGRSVAIDLDTVVVGAPASDLTGQVDAGAAYVYTRSGTAWPLQQKLTAMDALAADAFGSAVAVSGNTTVIGAPKDDTTAGGIDAGSAYVFVRSGITWTQQMQLVAMDGVTTDQFGSAVALAMDTAVIGSPFADPAAIQNAGAAYAFFRSGTLWTQQQKFLASDGKSNDNLGTSVAVINDTAVLGAGLADTTQGGTDSGAAYVWTRSGTFWTQQVKLVAADAASFDQFGSAVAVSTDSVLAGAPQHYEQGIKKGTAYVFFQGLSTNDPCSAASQCVSNICINNTCRSGKLQGVSCLSAGECATGFCADGVCCDTACGDSQDDCQGCSYSTGAAINGTCKVAAAAHVCRAQASECDVVEYCDGTSPLCPANAGIGDGMPCPFGTCRAGLCVGDGPLAYVPPHVQTGCTLATTHGTSQAAAGLIGLLVLVLLRRARRGVA